MPEKRTKSRSRALHISLIYGVVAGVWLIYAHGLHNVAAVDFLPRLWNVKSAFLFLILTILLLYHHLRLFEARQTALARHYDSLGKYANDIIVLFDNRGRIVEVNDRALAAYGYTYDEMLAMNDADLLPPAERGGIATTWDRIGREGGLVFEAVHMSKDGSTFPVEISARVIEAQGQEWRQATIRDITERKQVERALRESEEKFRNIMESSLISIYVIQDGVFKYVNPTLLEKTGYNAEDLLEKRNPLDLIAPEYREMVARNLRERLAGVPGHPYEIRVLRKDGSLFDVVAWGAMIQYQGRPANAGTLVDITEQKRAEIELRKLSRAIEQTASAVLITDSDGNIEYVNPRFTESTGYTREEAIGKNPRLLKSGHTSPEEYQRLWDTIASGRVWKGEFRNKRKDGSYYWEFAIISPVVDERGGITHFVAVKDDITTQKASAERIERLVHYDALTGLLNRDSLCDRMTDAINPARSKTGNAAMLVFDIDRFKDINDSLGHQIGNQLLLQLATRLRHCLRDEDSVARISGDEFAAVLPDTDVDGATQVGQKLLRLVQEPFVIEDRHLALTFSIGIATFPADGEDADTLLRNAAAAQHQAGLLGGDNYQFFATEMNATALQHLTLENELRQAVQRGELELHFQPQIRLGDGVINGAEALVRWRHPERGLISPAEFIPIAEESGIIVNIGQWVLREACRQAKAWQLEGLPAISIAVNLSSVQFRRCNILEQVREALSESGLEARYLELELTESVILQGMDAVLEALQQLSAMGVAVSIDDFGTGYSSFTYLRKLHVDKLKIDQSFVRGVHDSEENAAIVNAIIALARAFKLSVVAEGVETDDEYRFIKQAGCDQVQGYYCSRPLDVVQFKQMLAQGCPHFWQ